MKKKYIYFVLVTLITILLYGFSKPKENPSKTLASKTRINLVKESAVKKINSTPLNYTHKIKNNNTLKIFILAGQSNMASWGLITKEDNPAQQDIGTLKHLIDTDANYNYLSNGNGGYTIRDDVWVSWNNSKKKLTPGFNNTNGFGPEIGFGHTVGNKIQEQVLIIKIARGGKSLGHDYLPPSSEIYPTPVNDGDKGFWYKKIIDEVEDITTNLSTYFPEYDGNGFEIVGFGWHQGWNDRINESFTAAYEANMTNFITDIRSDLNIPKLPFVIATTGMDGSQTYTNLEMAQLAIANASLHPEFQNNVAVIDTRKTYNGLEFWQSPEISPQNMGYHWNRNAKTYINIGNAMGIAMNNLLNPVAIKTDIYFAQTHVQKVTDPFFKLTSDRDVLIKVNLSSASGGTPPQVSATLSLANNTTTIPCNGTQTQMPATFNTALGQVEHKFEDSFVATIPKTWVKNGLEVTLNVGDQIMVLDNLNIGAPNKVYMTMIDFHFFKNTPGDYPEGWLEELESKWPVSEIDLYRVPNVVLKELTIPPRANVPAARVGSKQDYFDITGINFDGEQAATLNWNGALRDAAGTNNRQTTLFYGNIYGVGSGGQAGGFSGVGNGKSIGILNHELGHALSLPHWGGNNSYPYKGDMHGIPAPDIFNGTHIGPVWAFDLKKNRFIPPTVQPNTSNGVVGTYKASPMQGGGTGDQEAGFLMRHFSDYGMNKMRGYMENHIVVWDDTNEKYMKWDDNTKTYSKEVSNNGVQYSIERNVDVISVMTGVSSTTPQANIIYPPIGPYKSGLIHLFDPRNANDRIAADQTFCPNGGCDVSLKIEQGGAIKIYMLPITIDPSLDPLNKNSFITRALNIPAIDGSVTKVELLETPNAESEGLPSNPTILDTWEVEQLSTNLFNLPNVKIFTSNDKKLTVSGLKNNETAILKIYTLLGQELYNQSFIGEKNNTFKVPVNKGLYIVKIESKTGNKIQKIIIE